MRFLALALLVACLSSALPLLAEEGQGPGDTSNSTIDDLFLGEYWFGAPVEDEDLQGKVVLFEIWGS